MVKVRPRGEKIRDFILREVAAHPADIARVVAQHFGITRQAAHKHLQNLIAAEALRSSGHTRQQRYTLRPIVEWRRDYLLAENRSEDVVWRQDVAPALGQLPANVIGIWHYGFTEMFNNVIDHSEGTEVTVHLTKTAADAELLLIDNGVGIFRKIQSRLGLLDERHAVLELAKGKLTTDPAHHTGEGIFFTSHMYDRFDILSGDTHFSHKYGEERDWIFERGKPDSGTAVWMQTHNHTSRTVQKVFKQFSSGEDLAFTKTVVPVRLAQYGEDRLISRSQAKRLLACQPASNIDQLSAPNIDQG